MGDQVALGDASIPGADPNHPLVTVVVVGIDEPDPSDPAWLADGLDLTGTATLNGAAFRGPFLVASADLLGNLAGSAVPMPAGARRSTSTASWLTTSSRCVAGSRVCPTRCTPRFRPAAMWRS